MPAWRQRYLPMPDTSVRISPLQLDRDGLAFGQVAKPEMKVWAPFPGMPIAAIDLCHAAAAVGE